MIILVYAFENSKSNCMAELTCSVPMPKSEFTDRQRQAWHGGLPCALVHLHHHMHRHASICTIICTIVGTIAAKPVRSAGWHEHACSGKRAPWQRRDRARSELARRLAMASGHAGPCSYYETRIELICPLSYEINSNLSPTLRQ